jgi:peroxiredoxin
MRKAVMIAPFLALAVTALATLPLPRKAPEFTIVEPSGKQTLLSSYKGKVVVLAFMQTTCPHCQRESQMLAKLYGEMKGRGLQTLGVTFNENAKGLTPGFVQQFNIPYPVGYSNPDAVLSYLGFSVMDRWMVPQVVVIDRKGQIRAQSPPQGDPNLQDEKYLRTLVDGLLKEGTAAKKTS